jgi:hypothetical protein
MAFSEERCSYCGGMTFVSAEVLRQCSECQGAWWNNPRIEGRLPRKISNEDPLLLQLLEACAIPQWVSKESYVYVLEIDFENKCDHYVGQTGLHPLHRLLNHVRRHGAAPSVKGDVVGLRYFEGLMSNKESEDRESLLFDELTQSGEWGAICGGH